MDIRARTAAIRNHRGAGPGGGEEPRPLSFWASPGDERAVIVIRQPGTYVLVQDVVGVRGKAGIRIEADGVELRLDGFELVGCAGSLEGISVVREGANLSVSGGAIRGWGRAGIDAQRAQRCELGELAIRDNGGEAVVAGGETVVRSCRLLENGRRPGWAFWRLAL